MRKLLIVLFSLLACAELTAGRVVYPGRSCPAIVQQGKTLEILYDNPAARSIDSVILRGPYNRVPLRIVKAEQGSFEYDNYTKLTTDFRITAEIPAGTPEELYDLIVVTRSSSVVSPRSVKTVREFSPKHRVLHFSDPHVTRMWVQSERGNYGKELELLDRFIEVANIIAPDFVMVTGDLIHDYTRLDTDSLQWGGYVIRRPDEPPLVEEKFRNFLEGAAGFSGVWGLNAPVFSCPGNHDFYGLDKTEYPLISAQWNRLMGKRVYGFSYAGTRVVVTDDFLGDPETDRPEIAPLSGLQGQVIGEFFAREGEGDFVLWGKHSHKSLDTAFMDKHRVRIILHGHSHTPRTTMIGQTPTLHVRTGVVCRSGDVKTWEKNLGFFRLFTIDGKQFTYTEPLRFCDNPTAPYEEIKPNLTLRFGRPNDGSQRENEAVVNNRFKENFPGSRVRFVMPKGSYAVSGGTIRQAFDNERLTVVDVDVDIKAKSEAVVRIRPAR